MMNTKGLFAVSLIAILAMGTANADIASKNYVDSQVGGRLTSISGSTSGTGNVVTAVSASGSTVSATKGITAEETKNKVTTVRATASATDTAYPSEKAVATALAGKADSADIPTVNNATLTIQKNGSNVGTFTANAASPSTINITVPTTTSQLTNNSGFITADDLPEDYVLTAATSDKLGGVKSGGDITVATDGTVTVNSATNADKATTATNATNATKASQDASGNVITTTYATKTELSTGLADKANVDDLATVATSGSYNDLTNKPTIPTVDSALSSTSTNPVQNKVINTALAGKLSTSGTAAKATADANGNNIVNTYATKTELGTVESAVETAQSSADAKVAKAQGSTNANKVLITDGSGNVTIGTVSSAMITDGTITNADISSSAAIAQSKISGLTNSLNAKANTADLAAVATSGSYNDLTNKPTIPSAYTLPAATSSALGGVKSGGDITVGTDGTVTVNSATNADKATTATSATKASQDASGNVITTTYATKTELSTGLSAKANTEDLATVATSGSYNDLTNKPTIPTVDSALSSTSTNPVQNKVINTALAGKLSTSGTAAKATADANGNNIASTYATKSQITALDSTSSGTGAVVTAVSQTDGKVSVTKGNVKIPVGSESATTYATIWVE